MEVYWGSGQLILAWRRRRGCGVESAYWVRYWGGSGDGGVSGAGRVSLDGGATDVEMRGACPRRRSVPVRSLAHPPSRKSKPLVRDAPKNDSPLASGHTKHSMNGPRRGPRHVSPVRLPCNTSPTPTPDGAPQRASAPLAALTLHRLFLGTAGSGKARARPALPLLHAGNR